MTQVHHQCPGPAQTLLLVCPAQAAGQSLVALAHPRWRSGWRSPCSLVCLCLAEADSDSVLLWIEIPGVGHLPWPAGQQWSLGQ